MLQDMGVPLSFGNYLQGTALDGVQYTEMALSIDTLLALNTHDVLMLDSHIRIIDYIPLFDYVKCEIMCIRIKK